MAADKNDMKMDDMFSCLTRQRASQKIMVLLGELSDGCPQAALPTLSGLSAEECRKAVAVLASLQLLRTHEEGLRLSVEFSRPYRLPATLLRAKTGKVSLLSAILLFYQRDYAHFYVTGIQALHKLIQEENYIAAYTAYACLIGLLLRLPVDIASKENSIMYTDTCLTLLENMILFPWHVPKAHLLYYRIRAVAYRWGNQRHMAKIDLAIGNLTIDYLYKNRAATFHGAMQRGIAAIMKLGDLDIILQASPDIIRYYFTEGEFQKAINFACMHMAMSSTKHNTLHAVQAYGYAALSALYLGEYDFARSIIKAGITEVKNSGNRCALLYCYGVLSIVLLHMDRLPEIFDIAAGILDNKTNMLTYGARRLARSMAYYYRRSDVQKSYDYYRGWMRNSMGFSFHSGYFYSPHVLELLDDYDRAGLPPLQPWSFSEELALSLRSPSRIEQGYAFRIAAARTARAQGWSSAEAAKCLTKSVDIFRSIAAPVELAKTLLLLAACHQAGGRGPEAIRAAGEAKMLCQCYGHPVRPPSLTGLPNPEASLPPGPTAWPVHVCANLYFFMAQPYLWDSSGFFFNSILAALLASTGAIRAALLEEDERGLHLLAAIHMADGQAEAVEKHPAAARCRRDGAPAFDPPAESRDGTLCLPVSLDDGQKYLLFLQGSFLHALTAWSLDSGLGKILGEYVRTFISIRTWHKTQLRVELQENCQGATSLSSNRSILFQSDSMQAVVEKVDAIAPTDTSVLILGESGVGKELVARRLHEHSGRSGPFIAVNLASTPEELFESEFYGHEKGSFTGANTQKKGLFELADKGTLFIDEVADIPLRLQVKLLRVLQSRQFMRVGGTRVLQSDFRLVSATNVDLQQKVAEGCFRQDLYYRIGVIPVYVPPLRERRDEVPYLADHFRRLFCQRHNKPRIEFTIAEKKYMREHAWPGNVRELENYVERLTLMSPAERSHPMKAALFRQKPEAGIASRSASAQTFAALLEGSPSLREVEDSYFTHVYMQKRGVVGGRNGIAATLGISESSAYARINRLRLREKTVLTLAGT